MRTTGLILAAGVAALSATQANAGCSLSIQPSSDNWRINSYDPFDQKGAAKEFDVVFVNTGDAVCRGPVEVDLAGESYGLRAPGGADPIAYSVIDVDGQTDLTPRAGHNARRLNTRPIEVAPGAREVRRFSLTADPRELPGAGDYSQTVFLSVLGEGGLPVAERPITLALQVASTAVMGLKGSFTPTGAGGLVDLGDLAQGQVGLPLDLYVKSTSGYRVTVSSQHNGRLKLADGDWYVPYRLQVGDKSVNLTEGDQFSVAQATTHDDSYPLAVSVGDVTAKRAGSYSDTVTFTVAAL